ncbi:MAG: flagellar basal body-associated FliL family protein [Nitrospirae bacterium]|nr:flagellar basal body-associated FliL family protein [Nitrospirota bacterium]
MEPFILNIGNHGDAGAIKVTIALELTNTSLEETAKKRTAQLRDAIIILLSTRSKEDLSSQEGKLQLKDEILLQANQIINEGAVRNVFFSDFVMQ